MGGGGKGGMPRISHFDRNKEGVGVGGEKGPLNSSSKSTKLRPWKKKFFSACSHILESRLKRWRRGRRWERGKKRP